MSFKKLLDLLEKGEDFMDPLSGIIGGATGILSMLGVGRNFRYRDWERPIVTGKQIGRAHV